MPIGNQVGVDELIERLRGKYSTTLIHYAINSMVKNQELRQIRGNRSLLREK